MEWTQRIAPFKEQFLAHGREAVLLRPRLADAVPPWGSNLCGLPYMAKGSRVPRDQRDAPMFMVAQLNWAEVPALEGFPSRGITQFWLADSGDLGMNSTDPSDQSNCRVLWIPDPREDASGLETIEDYKQQTGPFDNFGGFFSERGHQGFRPCGLSFERATMVPQPRDGQGEGIIESVLEAIEDENEREEAFYEYFDASYADTEHWIGGYSRFGQGDPRRRGDAYSVPLLFLGSDAMEADGKRFDNICWGDGGHAGWFIKSVDLEARDFGAVMFHWDN